MKFRLGYAPGERFALKEHLGSQGVSVEDMVETGLLISGDDIPVPYDRFRDRVMFPITDFRGRIIAFGGRALISDAPAKYLNSPETPLFHKGSNLYNGAVARQAVHDGAPLIVVEGYVDVIAMVTAGYPATVAPLGTALTEEQLGLLWKMADEPILCFDGDKAGRRAAYRAVDLAMPRLKPGKSLRFAMLPEGRTPTTFIAPAGARRSPRCCRTRGRWARCCGPARPRPPRSTRRNAAPRSRPGCNEVVRSIGDELVRKYYAQDFSARLRQLLRRNSSRAGAASARRPGQNGGQFGGKVRPAISAISPRRESGQRGPAERARGDLAAELAAVRQLDRARVPQRAAAPRGADPGRGGQPPLAAGTPRRGVFRARIPQSRHRSPAKGGHGSATDAGCGRPRGAARGNCGAGAYRGAGPGRGRHHPRLRLAGAGRRFRR